MSFARYTKQMKDESGPHWVIEKNALFCENFEVGKPFPRPDHYEVVDNKLVPFLHEAISVLGNPPGSQWILNIMGQASATGTNGKNLELSKERAYYLGEYAIAEFEDMWSKNPGGEIPKITARYHVVGDKLSKKAPTGSYSSPSKVEERQAGFRSVIFFFDAAGPHDVVAGGKIRTVTGMAMKPQLDNLDNTLKSLKAAWEPQSAFFKLVGEGLKLMGADSLDTVLGVAAKKLIDDLSMLASHPAVMIGKHMINVMIPTQVTYAYQLYDASGTSRSMPLIYRFDGVEHADNVGLLEIISWWAKLDGCIKAIQMLGNMIKRAGDLIDIPKAVSEMFMLKSNLQKFLVGLGSLVAGNRGAIFMAKLLDNYEYFGEGGLIATSDWDNFTYHRAMRMKSAHNVTGRARRFKAGGLWIVRETLDFGGPVVNNWSDWNATAEIGGVFNPLANSLLQYAKADGMMTLWGNAPVID